MMRWEMVLLSSLLYHNLLVLMKMKMFRRQSGGAWETPLTPGMTQVPGATHLALQAPHTISKHVLHVLWKLFDCCFVPLFLHLFDWSKPLLFSNQSNNLYPNLPNQHTPQPSAPSAPLYPDHFQMPQPHNPAQMPVPHTDMDELRRRRLQRFH